VDGPVVQVHGTQLQSEDRKRSLLARDCGTFYTGRRSGFLLFKEQRNQRQQQQQQQQQNQEARQKSLETQQQDSDGDIPGAIRIGEGIRKQNKRE